MFASQHWYAVRDGDPRAAALMEFLGSQLISGSGIYAIENLMEKKLYVGQSIRMLQRWVEHVSHLTTNKHVLEIFQQDWNRYGPDSFRFFVLEMVDGNLPERLKRENWWMQHVTSQGYELYNWHNADWLRNDGQQYQNAPGELHEETDPEAIWQPPSPEQILPLGRDPARAQVKVPVFTRGARQIYWVKPDSI